MMKQNPHGGDAMTVAGVLGNDSCPEIRLDFSVNINPLGPPAALHEVMSHGATLASVYPEAYAKGAEQSLAEMHKVPAASVLVGNGSTEIFGWILQAFRPKRVSLVAPCYAGYEEACRATDVSFTVDASATAETEFAVDAGLIDQLNGDMVFIGTPNNPTGAIVPRAILLDAARKHSNRIFVIDEAFIDFCTDSETHTLIGRDLPENIIVVKSLTKFFAIPGLRLGMACGHPSTIERINALRLPWTINAMAQRLALKLYRDSDYMETSRSAVVTLRTKLIDSLRGLPGVVVHDSHANFVLVRLPEHCPATRLQETLLEQGVLIRNCDNYQGLDSSYCRLAVRPEHEIDELISTIRNVIGCEQNATAHSDKPHTPAIMVVGTTSNAGKSVVAAGLCRLFARRGVSVAPFKAQNMALNSFVTAEGGEMGRAQVVQAQAAGVEPHTDMNPVLLKPLGEDGSQVIVNGKAIGNFKAREYYAMKKRMRDTAHEAYDRLAERCELIVLEGAGSPAEINLMEEDFVNMDMAAYAGAKTVLVADIDRGGVFASILGTISLLPERYRSLLAGVIINKFRGDVSLLDSGIRDIESMTGVPVLGVLPYMRNLLIEDEDSQGLEVRAEETSAILNVAVIRLPRISNFTDFLSMEHDSGVDIRYVEDLSELGEPDLIILPGTKSTRSDLEWLHSSGIAAAIRKARDSGTPIIGICGGYQMLGVRVQDPKGVEGSAGETAGLNILPVSTKLDSEKELSQVEGETCHSLPFSDAGSRFSGYEIHAGQTTPTEQTDTCPLIIRQRGAESVTQQAGAVTEDGLVFGCYVHGLFDSPLLRSSLWKWLCRRKSVPETGITVNDRNASSEFNRVADLLEEHLGKSALFGLYE